MWPVGPLVAEVSRESVVPCDVAPCREQDVVLLGHVEDTADVVAGPVTAVVGIPAEIEDLRTQRESLGDLPLSQPPQLPEVPVAAAGVDPASAPAIGRPSPRALLQPEREEHGGMAVSQAAIAVTSGYLHGETFLQRN